MKKKKYVVSDSEVDIDEDRKTHTDRQIEKATDIKIVGIHYLMCLDDRTYLILLDKFFHLIAVPDGCIPLNTRFDPFITKLSFFNFIY